MVTIAASLYLPEHVATMARRAYYYALGDAQSTSSRIPNALSKTIGEKVAQATGSTVVRTASSISSTVAEAAETARQATQGIGYNVADAIGEL